MRQGLHHQLWHLLQGKGNVQRKDQQIIIDSFISCPLLHVVIRHLPTIAIQSVINTVQKLEKSAGLWNRNRIFFLEESVPEPYLCCGWIFATGRLEIFISLPRHRQIWSRWFFNGLWQHNSMYVFYWGGGNINVVLKMPGNLDYFNRTKCKTLKGSKMNS